MSKPLEEIELFAWLGEDELGSGEIGLKQVQAPGDVRIPLVAIDEQKMRKLQPQLEVQANYYGKKIRLCKFVLAEVICATKEGE
jgi:hypothetical protein